MAMMGNAGCAAGALPAAAGCGMASFSVKSRPRATRAPKTWKKLGFRCDGGICEHGRLTGIVADHRAAGENRADLFKLGGVVPHVVEIRAGKQIGRTSRSGRGDMPFV